MAEPAPLDKGPVVVDGVALGQMTDADLRALAAGIVAKLREHPSARRVTPPNHVSRA